MLDANPYDKYANFKLAGLLNKAASSSDEIKHHLRRSFTDGDSNYTAQFYYARLLYLDGDIKKSSEIFRKLGIANLDTRIKKEPRGLVKEGNKALRYSGTITKVESSYGFLTRDGHSDLIFTHCIYSESSLWAKLTPQKRVSFELAFNYRVPFAINIKEENITSA